MSRRTKILLAAVLLMIILVIIGILRIVNAPARLSSLVVPQGGATSPSAPSGVAAGQPSGTAAIVSPDGATNLEALARSFTERFGSFSNQGDFENIVDLYPFMTAKMRQWAEKYVADGRARQGSAPADYFGMTTRALGSRAVEKGSKKTIILVTTQRRESTAAALNARVYNQDLELILIEDAGLWRVDEAQWK